MSEQQLKSNVFAIIESALNSTLRLDPATLNRLSELEGKTFQITCTAPQISLLIQLRGDGIGVQPDTGSMADAQIEGDSSALMQLLIEPNKSDALFNRKLKVSGDTQAASQLQSILSNLEIDWEDKLAQWVGDVAAHEIGQQTRSLLNWGQQTVNSLLQNTEEYLHEEARSMPPRLEVEAFYNDIDTVALAADRMSARIKKLGLLTQQTNKIHSTEETQP